MRIALDTNVLVAAFIAHGNCNELLEYCIVRHEVILSKFILGELLDVLTRKFGFTRAEAHAAVRLLRTRTRLIDPAPLPVPVCRDPDDDTILATARTAECDAIVTGDKDLTDLKHYEGIRILTPSEFWEFENEATENADCV
ncbi:MAG: putative toxin-antitoxin system toxin component, PIN family [Lentisphaerae bacterium]|nr:putative toxin-antitoxin system toxin component, PIN family [Lentisphaerota bacterium]